MQPNIVFITLDCVRPDYLGCYGNKEVNTPNIDYLAGRGSIVKRAYSHCPITGPAHLSIFTSTIPITHGLRLNGRTIQSEFPTMAEILRDSGYRTAAFTGAFVLHKRFGFDRGFMHYDDSMAKRWEEWLLMLFGYWKRWADTKTRKFSRNADRVTGSAIDWLKGNVSGAPFFMWLHYFDAHDHFRLPKLLHYFYYRSKKRLLKCRDYKESIEYTDEQLGRLISFLKKKGVFDNTLFVIFSDHGEVLNEYDFMDQKYHGHAAVAYNVTLRVSLIFSGPGVMKAEIKNQVFRHLDLLPTTLSLAGVPFDKYGHIEGVDLSGYLRGDLKEERKLDVYAETMIPTVKGLPEWRVLIRGQWKYVYMPQSGQEFLYDLEKDPAEKNDIKNDYQELGCELKAELLGLMRQDTVSTGEVHDKEVQNALEALGYF